MTVKEESNTAGALEHRLCSTHPRGTVTFFEHPGQPSAMVLRASAEELMQEFISMAASKFGLSEDSASGLTGGLLGKLKENVSAEDFGALADKIPGLSQLADAGGDSAEQSGGGGGLLGGLTGALGGGGGLLGGLAEKAGGAADIMGLVEKSGLDVSQAGGFVSSLVGWLKEKAGGGLIEKIVSQVPALKGLLG
jgi:hypothetical protein